MNKKLDFIFSRRSIRKYTDKEISTETITDLLEAAMSAPSAMAKDPWNFIVLKDKDKINEVASVLPNGKMLNGANTLILILGDIDKAHGNLESYMIQDCTAAVENILLAANALVLAGLEFTLEKKEFLQ